MVVVVTRNGDYINYINNAPETQMTNASIYSTKDGMAYQHGNSRTLVDKAGSHLFQVKKNGQWVAGRNRHAGATVEKVKKAVRG